jgi:hypothetical protein
MTGAEKVLLMTREFDPITEIPLHTTDFGEGICQLSQAVFVITM